MYDQDYSICPSCGAAVISLLPIDAIPTATASSSSAAPTATEKKENWKLLVTVSNEGGITPNFDMGEVIEDEIAHRSICADIAQKCLDACWANDYEAAEKILLDVEGDDGTHLHQEYIFYEYDTHC